MADKKMTAAKMTDSDLLSLCRVESAQAESYITSEIAPEREDAMERYLGEYYGDEVEGRSSVVMRDVLETIEWIMPSLLRIFLSGDDIVVYNPVGPEDEDFAQQATDLANVVFHTDNPGFLILNTWFKDALLQKMGVVKSHYVEREATKTADYTGLTMEQFMVIAADDTVEVEAHTLVDINGEELTEEEAEFALDVFHNLTVKQTKTTGKIEILPIPPEEYYQAFASADPDNASYLEHRTNKTRSALILEGFDPDIVNGLPGDPNNDPTGERQTRMGENHEFEEHADHTMSEVTVHDSYIYADTDGDGVAEWTNVVWSGDYVLEREEVDSQPFSTICPVPVPDRAYGMSLADLLMDITRIRTVIMRQTLDNLYLSNNPEREVDINKIVDIDDFLTSRPGGLKRVEQIGASREISHPFVANHSYQMLDGMDSLSMKRTGVGEIAMAVDADVLANETATASNNNMATRNQRVEMVARIFAETGVKHLFRRILNLLVENQDKPRTIKLRGEWVEMDASQWNPEMDVTIDVGLGHGNRDQQVAHLNNILMWQKEILASGGVPGPNGPMVTPQHIYNVMAKMMTAVGFKNADFAIADPGEGPMQTPQQENPQMPLIQAQMQIEGAKAQASAQRAQLEAQQKDTATKLSHHEAMQKLELEAERLDIEREKIAADMNQTAAKIRSDESKAAAQLDAKADLELAKIQDGIIARQEEKEPVVVAPPQ